LIHLPTVSQRRSFIHYTYSPREVISMYPAAAIHPLQLQKLRDMYIQKNSSTHKEIDKGPVRPLICQVLMVRPTGTKMRFYRKRDETVPLRFMKRKVYEVIAGLHDTHR
jgi:hypothetical protein